VSEENVERSRRVLEAFNARDMDALIVLFDPQVEVHARLAGLGEATIYNGHDGVRSWQADFDESWSRIRIEPEAYFDLGEQILTFYVLRGRGRQSGVETSMWFASVATWRNGLCASLRFHRDREEALLALGVTEDELKPIAP
jgi:ketosteroid isomerase-like protein